MQNWLGLSQQDDELILQVLDEIAASGKVVFRKARLTRKIRYNDIGFIVETARARRGVGPEAGVKINIFWEYAQDPIKSKKDIAENRPIYNLSLAVKEIRKRRDIAIRKGFGIVEMPDFYLENRVEKEASRDQYLFEKGIKKLAGIQE